MSIASASFAAGPYTVVWNSVSLGLCRGDAQSPAIRFMNKHQRLDNSNSYGQSLIGAIYLGRDARFATVLMEWNANTRAALFPYGANFLAVGAIGVDSYDKAHPLVLTAVAGSLAAAAGPATITATQASLAENFPMDVLFGPPLREVPIAMDLLPYDSSGSLVNGTFT